MKIVRHAKGDPEKNRHVVFQVNGWIPFTFVVFVVLCCVGWRMLRPTAELVETASADSPAAALTDDEPTDAEPAADLPPPPSDFVTTVWGDVRWVYPATMEEQAESLMAVRDDAWPLLEEDLGVEVDETLEVRLARDPEEMRALAPRFAPPPAYATGVAYTHRGLVLLSAVSPDSWELPDQETVFVHELSHVALRRAVEGHPIPRWFVEGLAIVQAREATFERMKVLWSAHAGDGLIPLRQLSGGFPTRPYQVNLAYAQSADVVTFLRSGEGDERRFHRLIEELAEGDGFESALSDAYALTPGQLERDWLEALAERVSSLPLLVGVSSIWALAAILLVLAWRRRRKDHRRRLAEMERQERLDDQAIARIEAMVDDDPIHRLVPELRRTSETDIPKVRHDGEEHTLH